MNQGSVERDENELLVPSITSVSTPESGSRKRPSRIVIKKQSSRHWDTSVEDHSGSLHPEPSLEDILSPTESKPSTLGAASTHNELSNQLWEVTLSPQKVNRKQLLSQLSSSRDEHQPYSEPIEDQKDDEDKENKDYVKEEDDEDDDSVKSLGYQKLLYATLDFEKDALNTPLGALASSLNHKYQDSFDNIEEGEAPSSSDALRIMKKMSKTLNNWRRVVLCMVHLRFADCAGQQEDSFHAAGLFPMATCLGLGEGDNKTVSSSHKKSKPGDRPTRRATLFGSIVGIYRSAVQEGVVSLFHCVGDDKDMISQTLRVRKSQVMHRVQKKPLNFSDLRPDTPKTTSLASTTQLTGLLAKLAVAKTTRKKNAIARAKVAKDVKRLDKEQGIDEMTSSNEVIHYNKQSHEAQIKLVKAEQRAMRAYERKQRMHDTSEFFIPRQKDIFSILRRQYDPEGLAHPANRFYTAANLLRREALRFDERVQFLLRAIWKATDVDNNGAIDKTEYFEMHGRILCALLGRSAGDSSTRAFLAMEDWESDCQGYRTLNRRRLEDCYFTLADRFTANIDVTEYTLFLNRLLGRMVEVDGEGLVRFKTEEEIFSEGDKDPLLDENSVFQFISAEERAAAKASKPTTLASVVSQNMNNAVKKKTKSVANIAKFISRPSSASNQKNNNTTSSAPSSARGTLITQRSRSCSELAAGLEASKSSSSNYHEENVELEASERDLARWKKLFILAGCSEEGATTDSREMAIESLRSYRTTLVVDVFEDNPDVTDLDRVDEDLETFLEVEFELPGHARKRQSLANAGVDNDIFAELLAYLPFQCFRSFDDFCTHLQRRRRMVAASRKVEHRTTFLGALAATPGEPGVRSHSAGKADKRRPSSGGGGTKQRRPSSANRPSSASSVQRRRPSSASRANTPSPRDGIADRVRGSLHESAPPPPDPSVRMFVRDKLMVNTSKNHRDIEADGEWKPSLSPLPATPLLSEMSRKKLLVNDQTSPAAARGLSFEGEDDEEVGDKTPLISARSFGNDEDEILFTYEDEEEAKRGLLSNSREHSSDDPTTVPIETTSPPKKKTPYKALPTKHLPKYRALYNFISYEDCHLAVEKGDILFAIPDLDGEPLTEDGWTYCMLEGNIELRGYVPDTFILFLSPDAEDMRNKYHIALVKPPKERLYDIKNTQLFKINTQLAKEQQEQQIENDKLLSKLPTMKHADIKSELIKRGLDVKGNLHVLTDRLKDELRDKGFEHGEIVDYLSEGGTRHRAVIIHSARSDPSILNRQHSLTDSSKVSTLPSVTAGEEGSIDLVASVNNGSQLNNQHGASDGNVEGGGSGLDPHNLAKNSLEEDEPENYEDYLKNRLNDDDEEARNRFNQFQNEFDENHSQNNRVHMQNSEEDMDNLRELLKARSRRPRSGLGAHGRLLYPTGDWNLQFPGYNFDAEILFRQRGVEAESDTKMYGTGVRVGSNYPATANIFHNGMVRNEASLQAAARFPSRMPTSSSRPSSAIDRPSARLSGNPLGRPYSAGTGLRAVRNELTPNHISIDGGPTRAASYSAGPASSFGPKGRYHNTLSQSWQPSSNNDLKLLYFDNNSKNSKNKAPRTISGSGGGYYGTPDHTFGGANSRQQQSIEFQSSTDHEVSASHHSASFLANFGVDGSNEGDPPAHVMPPSFWVYGAQVQEITPEALAAHTAQQENGGGSETAEAAGYGVNQVIAIPSRVPHLPNSSTTDSSYDHSKPSLGLFDKKNAIPKNDFHHHPEFGSNSGNVGDSFVSQQTPQFTHEYAPQSNGAFRSSPTKKMKNKKSTNPTGHHHHKSPVKASKSHHHHHHLKQDGPHGPFTDPRPRPKPDDIHLFPWRQKMWEAQERAQKKESKKYAATRALMAENDKCENAPLLLKTKSPNSVGSSHTSPRNQPQHQYLPERVPVADGYRSTLKKKTLGLNTKKRSSLKTDQNESALVVGHNPFLPNNQGIGELASSPYVMNNKEPNRKYLTSPQSIRKMDLVNQPLPKVMIGSSEYEPPPKTALSQEIVVPQAIRSAYMRRPVSGNRLGPFENRLESRCWNSGLATRDMALDVDNIQQTEVEAKRAERDQNYDKFGVPKNYKFPIASKDDKISSQGDLNSASFMKDLSSQNSSQVDHKKSIDTSIGGGQSGLVSEQGSGAGKPFSNTYIENSVYSQESKLGSLLGLDDEDMEVQPTSTSLLEVEQWR